ncbi:hypothetical protein GNI_059900 [Gregarina niphandrodes]|uniref:Uncharacterized protein n=1 Tax=Gregarina niphandrodes TaxID=110365 RepID=A0A023B8L5_GRENI|nr:hypothetical protein GNI_059900 [Gregarina niphandrodes]EZG69117.1 hypothetical protein GNI_059900 [Gregarina niphandrodes]|eukprot:XP_011134497.1 hypothetical protein GNI_059900 [Gregarina niphandrodes]
MSIAESLPALPGLYFDKKQKGFRVRYQNVYVGWVALSRFPSIEEAYCSARDIWENAKAHAEKFQTPQAAVIASLPLQKQARASGKNRGGRPRTVTQLPAEWGQRNTAANWTAAVDSPNEPWYSASDSSLALYPKYNDVFAANIGAGPEDLAGASNPIEDESVFGYGYMGTGFAPSPISYGKPVSNDEFISGFDTTPWSLKGHVEN